jgi:peroxiredoxin
VRAGACWLTLALLLVFSPAWAVREGESAPDFSLPSVAGDTVTLSSLREQVVVLVFWASWSKNASAQLKELDKLERELGSKGLAVLGLNQREEPGQVADFAERYQLSMKMLLDDGTAKRAYGVNGLPDLWIADRKGVLRARFIGYSPSDLATIRATVEEALAGTGTEEKPALPAVSETAPGVPPKLQAYAHLQMGAAHINIGDAFVKAGYRDYGHFDEALREFGAGLALDPDNPDLHIWLGLALERKGDSASAGREYQAALKLDPGNTYAQDSLRRLGVPWTAPPRAE